MRWAFTPPSLSARLHVQSGQYVVSLQNKEVPRFDDENWGSQVQGSVWEGLSKNIDGSRAELQQASSKLFSQYGACERTISWPRARGWLWVRVVGVGMGWS